MTKNMTEGSPAKLILFFTLPLVVGNIFQQLYAFVDTLLVGRFLGVNALAAVGCTGALMFLMLGFVIGMTSGLSIYTGQRFGAKDAAGVRQSAAACTVISLAVGLVLTVFGVLFCRQLLVWTQTPEEILDGAYAFLSIIFSGILLFVLLQLQTNLIRALGNSKAPTILLAVALCINIILEPIAILVLRWGIPGAAIATVTSQAIGNVLCYLYIRKNLPDLHIHREDWRFDKKVYFGHVKIGLPMGFQTSIIAIGSIILQIAINQFGPVAVASYAAAQKVEAIALMPMMSFGMAMAAYTAQNYGAHKFHRIGLGVKKCAMMSVSFSIVVGILLILFGTDIIELFVGEGQEQVLRYGQRYLVINGSCYWILSLLFIFRYTLQGLGQSIVPTIAGIMELIMRTLAAVVLCAAIGFTGACIANPMAWIGSCVPLAIAFFWTWHGFRRQHDLA